MLADSTHIGNHQIPIIQGHCMQFDEDFILPWLWDGSFLKFQRVDPVFAMQNPLLHSLSSHVVQYCFDAESPSCVIMESD